MIVCLLIAGFLLASTYQLGREALWIDEMHSLRVASLSFAGTWREYRNLGGAYLLYFVFLGKIWIPLFGSSDAALRAFSILGGVIALVGVWRFARLLVTPGTALLSLGLAATSPFLIALSQEVRMYSWLVALVALNGICFVRIARVQRTRTWSFLFVTTAVIGLYTHLFFALSLIAQFVALMFTGQSRSLLVRRFSRPFVIVTFLSLPMLFAAATATANTQDWKDWRNVVFGPPNALLRFAVGYWILPPSANWKEDVIAHARHDIIPLAACALALLILGSAGLRVLWQSRRTDIGAPGVSMSRFIVLSAFVPVGLLMAATPFRIVMSERYVVGALPFFWLVMALGFVELWNARGRSLAVVGGLGVLVSVVGAGARFVTDPLVGHEQWHGVARVLADSARAGEPVWVHRGYMIPSLNRYILYPSAIQAVPADKAANAAELPQSLVLVLSHVESSDSLEVALRKKYSVDWSILFPQESGIIVLHLSRMRQPDSRAQP